MSQEIGKILTKTTMSSNDIKALIGMINVESANSVYRRCADEFNFRTVDLEGEVYSTASELARPLGYSNSRSVSDVLKNHKVVLESIVRFRRFTEIIRGAFNLAGSDNRTQLSE